MNYKNLNKDELISKIEQLELDLIQSKKASEHISRTEETVIKQNSTLKFINSMAISLADKSDVNEFSKTLLKNIQKHTGAVLATFSYYQADTKELLLRQLETEKGIFQKIVKISGNKITKTASPVDNETYRKIIKDKIGTFTTFTEVTFGTIPPLIDKAIRSATGIDRLYPVAHVIEGELYGTTMLAFKKGQNSPSMELLESYAHLMSVSLRRYNAEKALSESEGKYKNLVETASDAIYLISDDGTIIDTNQSALEISGKEYDEIVGHSFESVDLNYSVSGFFEFWKDVPLNKQVIFETTHQHKNGNKYPVELSAKKYKISDKTYYYGVARDITERKILEAKVREKDLEFRKLSANVPGLIYQFTRKPDGSYHVPIASEGIKNIFGCSPEEVIDSFEPIARVIHSEDAERVLNDIEYSAKNLTFFTCEFRVQIPNKSIQWIYSRSSPEKLPDGSITWYGFNVNITERKKEEEELIKAKEKAEIAENNYNQTVSNITSIVWKFDVDKNGEFRNVYISEVADRLLELPKGSINNNIDYFFSFVKPDYLNEIKESILNGINFPEKHIQVEYEVQKQNGETAWFLSKGKLSIRNNIKRIYGYTIDISREKSIKQELKAAKEKAEENSTKYKDLFVKMMNAFALHEMIFNEKGEPIDYKFLEVNPVWEKIVGMKAEKVINKTVREIMPDVEESWLQVYGRIVKTGIPEEFEDYNKATDKYYHIYAYRTMPNQFAVLFNDISEEKKAEVEIKRMAEMLTLAPNAITISDYKGNFLYANKKTLEIFGYTMEEFMAIPLSKLDTPETAAQVSSRIKKITENREARFEVESIKKDGSIIPMEIYVKKTKWNNLDALITVATDITERKQAEIKLRKAKEKAEESDRLKSAFLANMSHEIRTPMNGILGFTSLLREPELSGTEQQRFIDIIEKSGDRMLNTINDIIEVSKIETGQVKLMSNTVNSRSLLQSLHDFFILEAEKKEIKLVIDDKLTEENALIFTDKNKLNSILTNLIKNAIKFTDKGEIEIGCEKIDDLIKFYIKDTGIGIPPSRKEAIFNRFEQADIENKGVFEGSGLGLSIAKSYIEMLGGQIWVESEENTGSTFYFTIAYDPVKKEVKSKNIAQNRSVEEVKNLNVLIVEDDETSSLYLSTVLQDFSNNIQIITNGMEAVETCRANSNFDVIFMDIRLPGLDGLQATEKIRAFNKSVVIIAQTAHALQGDKEKAIEAGCNEYISKPINKTKLIKLIEKSLK